MFKGRKIAMAVALSIGMTTVAMGSQLPTDVPTTHWGHGAIVRMAQQKIMVGDSGGKFYPDQQLDIFMAAKILAKASGYKDATLHTNITTEEIRYNQLAMEANASIFKERKDKFSKWDVFSEKELAYLLQKRVIAEIDLFRYMVKDAKGVETYYKLSREDAAIFLVRLMGKEDEIYAQQQQQLDKFQDDDAIAAKAKPYVYYLRKLGVIQGGVGTKFNPKSPVTNATIAVMLDKSMNLKNTQANPGDRSVPPTIENNNQTENTSEALKIELVQGKVSMVFSTLRSLQILDAQGRQSVYQAIQKAKIYVDDVDKSYEDIKVGMNLSGITQDGQLVEIRAKSISTPELTSNVTYNLASAIIVEGIVTEAVQDKVTNAMTIGVEVQTINPWGVTQKQVASYIVHPDCKITRGEKERSFSDISKGDIVKAKIVDNSIFAMELVNKNHSTKATLKERLFTNGLPILVFVNQEGKQLQYQLMDKTDIYKKDIGAVKWDRLRIGDYVEIYTEYDKLLSIYAEGTRSTKEGRVEEITIGKQHKVSMRLDDGTLKNYSMLPSGGVGADIYALRLGQKVRISSDSDEIETISILQATVISSIIGTVESISITANTIRVHENKEYTSSVRQFQITNNTTVVDAQTGNKLTLSDVKNGHVVLVTLDDKNAVKTLSILNRQ